MKTSKSVLKVAIYAGLLAALVAGVYFGSSQLTPQKESTKRAETNQQQPSEAKKDIVSYKGVKGETALATLLKTNTSVTTKESDYGKYVDTINGLQGGTDGNYWSFYINGELASIGAETYVATGEETIEWKFVNLQ